MNQASVPCPLGAKCNRGGRHIPGSKIMEEHSRLSRTSGVAKSLTQSGPSPRAHVDEPSMKQPALINGSDLGLGPDCYLRVFSTTLDNQKPLIPGGPFAGAGLVDGRDIDSDSVTEEQVRAGLFENVGTEDEPDMALTATGLDALNHFLRSDFEGEEEMRGDISVYYEQGSPGERFLQASVNIPVNSLGDAINNRERSPQEVADDYIAPLRDAMDELLDPDSGRFIGDRIMSYYNIPPSERLA